MNLSQLTRKEMNVIKECLDATVEGPFFEEWEFHSLFGVDRDEVQSVANDWPNVDISDEKVKLSVNGSLVNLWGYPHGKDKLWSKYISIPREYLEDILNKIKE